MHFVTIAALAVAAWGWCRGRKAVAGTTLLAAWRWGAAALSMSLLAAVAQALKAASPGGLDHLWYAACVLWVCPAVAVLGARRPGSAAWYGFVMVPLLLVLEWPVSGVALAGRISGASQGPLFEAVRLGGPELVVWHVVLGLGGGNYLMTRRGGAVLAGAGGVLALLWPLSGSIPSGFWTDAVRLCGSLALAAAPWWAGRRNSVLPLEPAARREQRLARAWDDFYQAYGLVWAVRVEARVNEELARLEGGGVLGPGGVRFFEEDLVAEEVRDAVYRRAESTLRWLWGRFVDEVWVEKRLGPGAPLGAKEPDAL
jgi:hypothetical protein